MTVLDVYVNDRKRCRAGVGADGVLTAIVNWVKLTGGAAKRARQLRQPLEESRLHVGGLRGKTHRSWVEQDLKLGDRVTIRLTKSAAADPATREGRDRRIPSRLRKHQTRFLNVDLDVRSKVPLDSLARALAPRVFALYVGREGSRYAAHFEIETASNDADKLISQFVADVRRLPRVQRKIWDRAEHREFNLGFQSEARPHAYQWRLDPRSVREAASVNAGIGVTVYAPAAGQS